MIDIFIQMEMPVFLGYFTVLSIVGIVIARFWVNADGSSRSPLPELTRLKPFEMAALRDGRKGVIQTALFNLWNRKLITASGKGNTVRIRRKIESNRHPEGEIEHAIYKFAHKTRKPTDFFTNIALRKQIDIYIKPINQTLEQLHLKRTEPQLKQAGIVFWLVLFIILGVGGTKLYFGMLAGQQMALLMIMVVVMAVIAFKVLKPSRNTVLGRRYYQKLTQHFEWMKSEATHNCRQSPPATSIVSSGKNVGKPFGPYVGDKASGLNYNPSQSGANGGLSPGLCVAIFGISGLAGLALYEAFENAFEITADSGADSGGCGASGCGGGSGSGGSSGSCGGGGCGGGG